MQQKELERKNVANSNIVVKGYPLKESFDDDILVGDIISRSFKLSSPRQGTFSFRRSYVFRSTKLLLDDLAAVFIAEPDVETIVPTIPLEVLRFEFSSPYYSQPQGRCTCQV